MRMYSVSEAIGPAWERTKLVLRTGRWGTNFKMALVVLLAEMGALLVLPVGSAFRMGSFSAPGTPAAVAHVMVGFVLVMGLIASIVYLVLFYFGSRMQLTLVDLVLTREHTVAPLWARHRSTVWRWMGVKLVPSVLFLAGLLPFSAAMARIQQISQANAQAQLDPQTAAQIQLHAMHHAFAALFAVSAWYFVLFFVSMLLYSHARSFILPYLGIDQLSVPDALKRWLLLWRTYPGDMAGFVFFRILLLVAVVLGFYLALFMGVAIPALLAILIGVGVKMLVHGAAGTVLVACLAVVAVLVLFAWYLLLSLFGLAGYAGFFQCYDLYFLGGRDPRIGALLEPEAAIPVWTPPPSLPRDDDSSRGPDLPTDPALA